MTPHSLETREETLFSELEELRLELSRANELVHSYQKKGGEVLMMSPAAAKASALLKSGMSLTQIYSKYVEVRGKDISFGGVCTCRLDVRLHATESPLPLINEPLPLINL